VTGLEGSLNGTTARLAGPHKARGVTTLVLHHVYRRDVTFLSFTANYDRPEFEEQLTNDNAGQYEEASG